jgi:hypothetical protein
MKFAIRVFLENMFKKLKLHEYLARITGTLHEDLCIFMIIRLRIVLRMRNVSGRICRESQEAHFMFNNFFPKIVPFMRQCGKIWYSQTGHRWQYNMAHALCMLDK